MTAPRCVDCDAPATHDAQPSRGAPEGSPGPKCDRHAGPARTISGLPGVRCTSGDGCPVHPDLRGIHPPWGARYIPDALAELKAISEALGLAVPESWGGEESWSWIAEQWIRHMATTHGAHCAGRGCLATADTPAYVGALRRMRDYARSWHGDAPDQYWRGMLDAVRDLAHELGVDLDD